MRSLPRAVAMLICQRLHEEVVEATRLAAEAAGNLEITYQVSGRSRQKDAFVRFREQLRSRTSYPPNGLRSKSRWSRPRCGNAHALPLKFAAVLHTVLVTLYDRGSVPPLKRAYLHGWHDRSSRSLCCLEFVLSASVVYKSKVEGRTRPHLNLVTARQRPWQPECQLPSTS